MHYKSLKPQPDSKPELWKKTGMIKAHKPPKRIENSSQFPAQEGVLDTVHAQCVSWSFCIG